MRAVGDASTHGYGSTQNDQRNKNTYLNMLRGIISAMLT